MNNASINEEHLKIISIFNYVVGGLAAVIYSIPLIHMMIGIAMMTISGSVKGNEGVPLAILGMFFAVIGAIIVLIGWSFAVLIILTGVFIHNRRHYTFCLVMSGIECMFFPFGTLLGVFSIILLAKPEVRALFGK